MIKGMHGMFYSSEPEALRAFFRDKLGFPSYDVGGGWLIFDMPAARSRLPSHRGDAGGGGRGGERGRGRVRDAVGVVLLR